MIPEIFGEVNKHIYLTCTCWEAAKRSDELCSARLNLLIGLKRAISLFIAFMGLSALLSGSFTVVVEGGEENFSLTTDNDGTQNLLFRGKYVKLSQTTNFSFGDQCSF